MATNMDSYFQIWQKILAVLCVTICCLIVERDSASTECSISLRCYAYDPDGNFGYLKIKGTTVATWQSANFAGRKKRQLAREDAWHLFAIGDTATVVNSVEQTCAISSERHFRTVAENGNSYITEFYNYFADVPSGSWLVGCSAGGIDPLDAQTGLRQETQNLFRSFGIDFNRTSSDPIVTTVGNVLNADSGLLFIAQKGFSQNTIWEIVDSTAGAVAAALTADGSGAAEISQAISIDWACGVPTMMGTEVFTEMNDSDSSFLTSTFIVTNNPVSCDSPVLTGWEYIPNADNIDGPPLYFGFVYKLSNGSYALRGQQEIFTAGSSDNRQFICADGSINVQKDDYYGMWFGDSLVKPAKSIIRRQYQRFQGGYSWPCGRQVAAIDMDLVAYGSSNTFPFDAENTTYQLNAFRPIFDTEFVLSCGCPDDSYCQQYGDLLMECVNGTCACKPKYTYNVVSHKCINEKPVSELAQSITVSSTEYGEVSFLNDSNTIGNLVQGTCFGTTPGINPWIVIELGYVAEIFAVKVTIPEAPVGFLKFTTKYETVYSAYNANNLSLNAEAGDEIIITAHGPYFWILYDDVNQEGNYAIIEGDGTYSSNDLPIGINILSTRFLDDVGKIVFTLSFDNTPQTCLDVDNATNILSFGNACESLFYVDGSLLVHMNTGLKLEANGRVLALGSTGSYFSTSSSGGILDVFDLNDQTASTPFFLVSDPSLCIGETDLNIPILTDQSARCIDFTNDPKVKSKRLLWEVQKFTLDGNKRCASDVSIFVETYPVQPCLQIIDYAPTSANESEPFVTDVTAYGADFRNHEQSLGYDSSSCNNYPGQVFYLAQEMGLQYFEIGVARTWDRESVATSTFPDKCVSFKGNVENGVPFLMNCTSRHSGRFVALFTENQNDLEQLHVCDIEVYGKASYSCDILNGCCNQNCINGQYPGERTCACYGGYTLSTTDECTCLDYNECESSDVNINMCNNDDLASCENVEGSYRCICEESLDNVVVFDYSLKRCSVPQAMRDEDTIDNICSYKNGNCSDFCTPGLRVIDRTCECMKGRELQADGQTCKDENQCLDPANNCDQDPNQLGICHNQLGADPGYNCSCRYSDRGILWDDVNKVCTTGRNPDNLCSIQNGQCSHTCNAFALDSNSVESPLLNYFCSCPGGYQLDSDNRTCSDIDECNEAGPSVCDVGSTCINTLGSYTCTCPSGFTFTSGSCGDVDECEINNGGCEQNCTNDYGSYTCNCTNGYSLASDGFLCDDINECQTGNDCDQICYNSVGSYSCGCRRGYTLVQNTGRCLDNDECTQNNGGCSHTCTNTAGSYSCSCPWGYELVGRDCENIDECLAASTNNCSQVCTDEVPSFTCSCNNGYQLNSDDVTCDDIDECSLLYCNPSNVDNAICTNFPGSFECTCITGKLVDQGGTFTCDPIDECANSNDNNCAAKLANCVNTLAGYDCVCADGFRMGPNVCEDIDECVENTDNCAQLCRNTVGSFDCYCPVGYRISTTSPSLCDDIDECAEGTDICKYKCKNVVGALQYICICPEDYDLNENLRTCDLKKIQCSMAVDYPFIALPDPASVAFATLILDIENQILLILFGRVDNVQSVIITGFRSGSTVVEYTVGFQSAVEQTKAAYDPVLLRQAIEETPIAINNVTAPLINSQDAFQQTFTEETGDQVVIPVSTDPCGLFIRIGYCKQDSICATDESNLPYCSCSGMYTGPQCDILIITPDPDVGETTPYDDVTGLDAIVISIFSTLLVVMTAVLVFFCVYRCTNRPQFSKPQRYGGLRQALCRPLPRGRRQSYPKSTPAVDPVPSVIPWWNSLAPIIRPAEQNGGYVRETYVPPTNARVEPKIEDTAEERLSRWPAYRAYGIARRFTGSYGGSVMSRASGASAESQPYSWRTQYFQ